MIANRWWTAAVLAALTVSCSKKYSPKPITPEAAAVFGSAEVSGMGGSLVIDGEALRELGFGPRAGDAERGNALVEFAVELLPTMAAEMKDHPSAPILARSAVLLALVREWAIAPHAQRIGIVVRVNAVRPAETANSSLVLLAVREGEKENRALIQGLGAAVRAAAGREVVATENGDLCVAPGAIPEVPFQVCLHPGAGFIALGTSQALASLAEAHSAPAGREPGPALRLLVNLPAQGRGELVVEGHGALRVSGVFEPEDPALADKVEEGAKKLLELADQQRKDRRTVMAGALQEVKASIASDPDAPDKMKSAVAGAEVDRLLDPRGEYAAVRKSVKIERKGNVVTAELTIPEGQVRRFAQLDQGTITTVAIVGILSAIAIPNFLKYQCRVKTSEGHQALVDVRKAVESYRVEHGSDAPQLEVVDYAPGAGGRYTVCARSGCLPPAAPIPAAACEEAFTASEGDLCAAAEIDGQLDVWIVSGSGEPSSYRSACR